MLAKKTSKNQLTLPKEIAGKFPGVDLFEVSIEGGRIILEPMRLTPVSDTLDRIREKMTRLGLTEGEVATAVRWARRKKR